MEQCWLTEVIPVKDIQDQLTARQLPHASMSLEGNSRTGMHLRAQAIHKNNSTAVINVCLRAQTITAELPRGPAADGDT